MMKSNHRAARHIMRLADSLTEDILALSDEEVLAEFQDSFGDTDQNAKEMRALFEKSVLSANKARMAFAKKGVVANRLARKGHVSPVFDIKVARQRLRALIARTDNSSGLTLAARKEDELSDSDVLGLLEELAELGLLDDDPGSGK